MCLEAWGCSPDDRHVENCELHTHLHIRSRVGCQAGLDLAALCEYISSRDVEIKRTPTPDRGSR